MLKLKLQYFDHHANGWFIGKVSDAGKDWGQEEKRESEDDTARWHNQCKNMNLGKLQEMVRDREAWRAVVTKSQTQLDDWTITTRNSGRRTVSDIRKTYIASNVKIVPKLQDYMLMQFWLSMQMSTQTSWMSVPWIPGQNATSPSTTAAHVPSGSDSM